MCYIFSSRRFEFLRPCAMNPLSKFGRLEPFDAYYGPNPQILDLFHVMP